MTTSAELLATCACTRARTVARLMTRRYDEILRPTGLKASQLAVLAGVDSIEVASIADLSKLLFMDRTTLSRNLQPLISAGLVAIQEAGTGRSKTVTTTKAGEKALKAAEPLWQQAQAQLARQFGKGRLSAIDEQLRQLIASY